MCCGDSFKDKVAKSVPNSHGVQSCSLLPGWEQRSLSKDLLQVMFDMTDIVDEQEFESHGHILTDEARSL